MNRPIRIYKNTFLSRNAAEKIIQYFESINADNVLLITFSPNAKAPVKKNIIGRYGFWNNLLISDGNIFGNKAGEYLFPIQFQDISGSRLKINIGYICFNRLHPLSSSEIESIDTLASVLGSYFYKRLQETFRRAAVRFRYNCNGYDFSNKLAGTIVHQWISKLYKIFDTLSTFYISIDGNEFSVEYFKRDPILNFISNKNQLSKLDDSIMKKLNRGEKDFILKASYCFIFLKFINVFDKNIEGTANIYFNAIYSSGTCIGCWVFAYSKNQAIPLYNTRDSLELLNNKIDVNFNFLYQRRFKKMIVNPIFKIRNTIVDEKSVFVLMPFTLEWSDRIFNKILKPTIESIGDLKVRRADDLYGSDIMEDIWSSILQAKIIVADITERNANVFYELGICHSIGKEVILITQNVSDIPFDLNRYRHIIYKDNYDGYELLKKHLTGAILDILSK